MNGPPESTGHPGVPPKQQNLQRATEIGFEAVAHQPEEQIRWLGAEPVDGGWRLPVLNDTFDVDLAAKQIKTSAGEPVGPPWRILALHYLAIPSRPEALPAGVTFADLAAARSYSGIYQGRTIGRLCATAGRDAKTLCEAAGALGAREAAAGDLAFDFDMFPRVALRLLWHAPDEEFPPSATLLLPENIESFFCSEDIVVLSESLVARLGGRPF